MITLKDINSLILEMKRSPSHCYIFVSASPYLLEDAARAFIKITTGKENGGVEVKKYSGKELDIQVLFDESCLLPLFNKKKLIWIKDIQSFKDIKSKELEDTLIKILRNNYIVITGNMDSIKLFKEKDLTKRIYNLIEPDESGLIEWIQYKVGEEGKGIEKSAAEMLIKIIGTDLGELGSELKNLICYTGQRSLIKRQDVIDMYPFLRNRSLADFIRVLKKGNISTAVQIADSLVISEDPIRILSYLITVIKKELMLAGVSEKNYMEMLSYLHSSDLLLKSSRIPARIVLNELIVKIGNHLKQLFPSKVR